MGRGSYTVLTTSLLSRHYALTPLPPRPTLQPQVDTYRTRVRGLLSMILQPLLNTRYHLHVATSVLTDAPRTVVLRPTGYQVIISVSGLGHNRSIGS